MLIPNIGTFLPKSLDDLAVISTIPGTEENRGMSVTSFARKWSQKTHLAFHQRRAAPQEADGQVHVLEREASALRRQLTLGDIAGRMRKKMLCYLCKAPWGGLLACFQRDSGQ